uniref:Uncharacterized protein n=1 Tax=Globodera rostochiensis TaxID=31243 RepID=A0A914HRX5_GLORO
MKTRPGTMEKFVNVNSAGELSSLDRKIVHFIACTNNSFHQINHTTFHTLFSVNHPLQTIKDQKHYREWALPRIYGLAQKKFKRN